MRITTQHSCVMTAGRLVARRPSLVPQSMTAGGLPWGLSHHHGANFATVASFKIPKIVNEPNKTYAKGSAEREALQNAYQNLESSLPFTLKLSTNVDDTAEHSWQVNPAQHAQRLVKTTHSDQQSVQAAIDDALHARSRWSSMHFADRAAIFLKAADLVAGKYRYKLMAATMLGQGKNAFQAEIDAAAELADFLRFNVQYAEELYAQQPAHHAPGVWNRVEYRPLEGFVYAITPFNFTAIAGNLPAAPALMGNVVVWKPSPSAMLSNWILYEILLEAGLPKDVIQFVPGDAEMITDIVLASPHFSALHYTGSTAVFRSLYGKISNGVSTGKYRSYPRVVGETGGKNFHLIHKSANVSHAAINTVRGAFEYQGQKCSACSRAYVPRSIWPEFQDKLVKETQALKVGKPDDFANFVGPVIHKGAFLRLSSAIDEAKADPNLELLIGGEYDDSKGYFVHPTVFRTTDPTHPLLSRELFGPVLVVYVYDDEKASGFTDICKTIDSTNEYALTGAIFAQDREVIRSAEEALRDSAGNFYVNVKCTGAVVGQQPFGGARASGTNDKAGSASLLSRFVSMRSIKEQTYEDEQVLYPSNIV